LCPRSICTVSTGAPGAYKSFLLADLCGCVAGGRAWLPPLNGENGDGMPVLPGAAVWLDFDNGRRRTHDRFAALGRALQLPESSPLSYYSMPTPSLDPRSRDHVSGLVDLLKEAGAKLVVIDNLGAIIRHRIDRNFGF
jgi:hypothetical protein